MKEYIVSARKYRPMSFDSVVGQSALTTTLKNAVKSGKLAHAYLFCGPRGVGKTTCARIFAKAINCQHPTEEGEACNECESCNAFNEQRSYNIFELDAASNNSVENIKALMEQTRIPPQIGKYKVFIIDEVHMLSTAAFNAFLKTLEEPPAHVIFILATTEKHKILPTIISRCQIYDFERMTVPNIINHLKMVAEKEGITYEEDALNVIAEKADGGMRDALSVFDQAASFCQGNITYNKVIEDLNVLDTENYFNIIDLCLENKVSDVMVLLNSVINKGFDGGNLISGLAVHVRNVLMAKDEQTLPLLEVSQRQVERYKEQAKKCSSDFLYKALKAMNECDINYRQSNNKRLLVELTLIEIAQITQPEDDGSASGHGPKRLKTLFKRLLDVQSSTAQQVAVAEPTVARHTLASKHKDGDSNNNAYTQSGDNGTKSPTNVSEQASKPSVAPPLRGLKLGNIGKSFANLRKKTEAPKEAIEDEIEVKDDSANKRFTEEDLNREWLSMCNRMPREMTGMASRMKNMQPKTLDYPNIEVVVDNQIIYEDISKIKGRIRNTLAISLKNTDITLSFRIARPEEVKKILTNKERFEELKENNKAFEKLSDMLGLEIS
ncbi:MAG: DNA polymerase III subunit gamma/tau [Prevotellaceae bacterium]|nr:DNA polymerase III subunit gamma/tau [Prevotellaceae bacterium]